MQKQVIDQQKQLYKELKPCFCKTLNETVHFTADGLNHILYYRRRPRSPKEKLYRAKLISFLRDVITHANSAVLTVKSTDPKVTTWALKYTVKTSTTEQKEVKVILRKVGNGQLHFFSVMAKKTTKKPKKQKVS